MDFPFEHTGSMVALIAVSGGLLIALVSIIGCTIKGCMRTKQVEQTRRDIAAYVAEGSITPEDGERLMRQAGRTPTVLESIV